MADFSKTTLAGITLKAELMYKDAQAITGQVPLTVGAAKAVLQNQTARFEEITTVRKERKVAVSFITDCDGTTKDIVEQCTIDGHLLDSDAVEYALNLDQETSFKVQADMYKRNDYSSEEVIARGLFNAKRRLDNWLSKQVVARLDLAKGVNKFPFDWTYDAVSKNTLVPKANWTEKMIANLVQQADVQNISNPYYISDGNLFVTELNAQIDRGNAEGKGNYLRTQMFSPYFDQVNFIKASVDANLFMIDQPAVGLYTSTDWAVVPEQRSGITYYKVKSDNLPGVEYDVEYEYKCLVESGKKNWYHIFKLMTRGLFALNPVACNDTTTGVLGYQIKPETPEVPGGEE